LLHVEVRIEGKLRTVNKPSKILAACGDNMHEVG
jgi:hypothetical protein